MSTRTGKKNVLLITIDDMLDVVRYRDAFGVPILTPAIDELMQRGVTFENASTVVPLCVPSRTAVLTGRSPFETGVHTNWGPQAMDVAPAEETLIGQACDAGWYTAARGKLFHGEDGEGCRSYLSPILKMSDNSGGYVNQTDRMGEVYYGSPVPESDTYDYRTAQWASAFLGDLTAQEPFFLSVGILKPHKAWDVPEKYFDLYDADAIALPDGVGDDLENLPEYLKTVINRSGFRHDAITGDSHETWRNLIHGYLAAISYADAQIGRILDSMTDTGLWDSTTVLLWSDHGLHLGDRNLWGKPTLYEEAASIPFVVVDPDIGTPGARVSTPASALDIWPTLTGLTGIPAPLNGNGVDLSPLMTDPNAEFSRHGVITSLYGSLSLRTEKARYNLYLSGEEEMFPLNGGQVFGEDVSDDPGYQKLLGQMRTALETEARAGEPDLTGPV
ncbi:sulfatase-like hydrolase/transferase [Tropicimonas aquimaris]|uniref:Sulfatase-like hydrolase/transferase n=1 Tax=Tropicimonas aquimaris TaxID=914152 RepID=A0ABW3IWG5_9RHOB